MGSTAEVVVDAEAEGLLDWAELEVARLEQCLSRFRPDSELSRLNRSAEERVVVSRTLALALDEAARLATATHGRFDPTVLDALEQAGYDRSFELLDLDALAATPQGPGAPVPGFGLVELDLDGPTVRRPPGLHLDLGGVGKGLAADLVAEGLVAQGAGSALVAMGGDVRVAGEPPDGGWPVPVEDPRHGSADGRVLGVHHLHSGGLVTSTRRFRCWSRAGTPAHHLIDPATGRPSVSDLAAVIASAPRAGWAEGVAKAALVGGSSVAPALLARTGVRAVLVTIDGSLLDGGLLDGGLADGGLLVDQRAVR